MSQEEETVNTLKPPVSASDHRVGSERAIVTLVEYGDYECPHCAAAQPIIREVRRRLGDRLRFVFRHFPLSAMHPHADHAAEAAEAAGAQGKFWEMHETLFEQQAALDDVDLLRRAVALELDVRQFENELAVGRYELRVRKDFQSGVRSGVNGTPTFLVNGVRHDDEWDADTLVGALSRAATGAQV